MATTPSSRATSREVARLAGVSQATVSNVLNRPHLVAASTRERVRSVIEEIGFVVHDGARRLRAGRSGLLAMSVLDAGNPFWGEVMRGVADHASDQGLLAVVGSTNESREKESRYLTGFREQRAAGLLVAPVDPDLSALVRIADEGTAVVLLDYRDPSGRLPYVGVDDERGGALAGDHLVGLGHERIAMVNGPHAIPWCADRRRGLDRALRAHGLEPATAVTELPVRRLTAIEGDSAVAEGLADCLAHGVTAVFCANDLLALGVLRGLQRIGVRVPEDVSLVGYDDDDFSEMLLPPMTTVRQRPYELGQAAARLALALIDDPDGPGVDERALLFTPELVVRESSADR